MLMALNATLSTVYELVRGLNIKKKPKTCVSKLKRFQILSFVYWFIYIVIDEINVNSAPNFEVLRTQRWKPHDSTCRYLMEAPLNYFAQQD